MLKRTLLAATLAMLILVASPTLAAPYLESGFESDAASTVAHPDTSGDYDPAGFGIAEFGIGTPHTYTDNPTLVQVTSYGTPGPSSGSKYLRINSWISGWARLHDTEMFAKQGNLYVFADLYMPSSSPNGFMFDSFNSTTHQKFFVYVGDPDDTSDNLSIKYQVGLPTAPIIDTGYDAIADEWQRFGINWTAPPSESGASDGTFDMYYGGVKIVDGAAHNHWVTGTCQYMRQRPHYGDPGGYPLYMDNYVSGVLLEGEELPLNRLLGDADRNGVVSADDFAAVQSNFGLTGAGIIGDADYNGVVSADDFAAVQANFGNHLPEPATLAVLGLGVLSFLVVRRRR